MLLTSATTMNTAIAMLLSSAAGLSVHGITGVGSGNADNVKTPLRQVIEEDIHGVFVSLLMLDEFYEGGWGIKWHIAAWEHMSRDMENFADELEDEAKNFGHNSCGVRIYSHVTPVFRDLTGKSQRTMQTFVQDHIFFFRPQHLAYCT